MATFVNDLRLTELATGEGSGTWGTTTNTNLELIAESFSFGTEAITTNADTHTTTIADGSTDPGRSLFLKYTGTLDSACTITIGPNTVSKLWFIENATSGSQNIIISQGSGADITIPNGQTKAIYSDGAGSGAAMVDAFQDLSIPDLFVDDDLTVGDDLILSSDSAIIKFGADADTTLTHTDGSGLTLNSTNKIMFNDASQFIQGSSATVLSLGATDEIDLTATAIDVNGTIDVSGNATLGGTLGVTGAVTADAGISIDNITIDGTEIDLSSGDLTIDVAGDIILDANGADVLLKDDGTTFGEFTNSSTDFVIKSSTSDKDMLFKGNVGGSEITALTLDMSAAGAATFNDKITAVGTSVFTNLDISGDIDVDGTTNLDVVDIDGAVDMASTLQVDGAITSSSGATITVSDNSDTLSLVSTDADASNGPVLRLYRNSSSPADNDFLGNIQFVGRNDNSQDVQYAEEEVYILDASDGTEDGLYNINVITGGTNLSYLQLKAGTGSVFNEDSNDIDFRVEGNGNANLLTIDAGNDQVGVGVSPSFPFHASFTDSIVAVIDSDNDSGTFLFVRNSDATTGRTANIGFAPANNIEGARIIAEATEDSSTSANRTADIAFQVRLNGTMAERWRIHSTGVFISQAQTPAGISGTPADANFTELGSGYLNLARDDTADADQVLFAKNGAIHSKITTSASGLTVGSIGNLNTFINAGTSGSNVLDLQSGGTTRVRVQNSGLEVNPSGLNSGDLIAQSDNNTHMLFVDASADAVGVGVSDPAGLPLHLKVSSGDNKLRQETAAKDAFTLGLDNSTGDTIIGTNTLYPHVRFLDGGGMCFGSDTAAANALDDYEEGTWTPAFANGFDGNYTVQQGQYTKIGRQVIAALHLDINSASTGSTGNQIKISGLPFLPDVGTTYGGSTSIHGTSWATGRTSLNMLVFDNNTTAVLYYNMCASVGAAISPTYADIGSGNLLTVLVYNADT